MDTDLRLLYLDYEYQLQKEFNVRVSFKQALAMLDILKASLATPGSVGGYPLHIRKMLVHQLINQQSSELFDLMPGEELSWDWEELDGLGGEDRVDPEDLWEIDSET